MTNDYAEQTEVEYKDSPYDVCGVCEISRSEKNGQTVNRDKFVGEEKFVETTVNELLEIYENENGKE